MTRDFEPTDSQKAILSQLAEEARKREESLDLIVTEGSNDSLYGFLHDIDKVSQIRNLARESEVPEREIHRTILRGIPKKERRYLYLSNTKALTIEEINELAEEFGIDLF